jgi:N-dimethylarginine dimethylaminohydrolase
MEIMNKHVKVSENQAYMNLHRRIQGEPEPAFEEPTMLEKVWGKNWRVNNDVGGLQMALMSRPGNEWEPMMSEKAFYIEDIQASIGPHKMWYWKDRKPPDLAKAQEQHDELVKILHDEGVEIIHLEDPLPHMTKSVFTRDPAIMVKGGAILCRMGVSYRRGEELPIMRTFAKLGIPILRTIHGTGLMEGGSFLWLNDQTAVVSIGHRSNIEGARQLEEVLNTLGVELICVENTGYGLHIDGSMVMVDVNKALVFFQDLPWWFLDRLKDLGIQLIDADPRDGGMGVNCLAVKPGRVIMSSHAKYSADALDAAGTQVVLVDYDEIHKNGGGIHCSTLPLIRDDI